jgi:hypothetical protein
MRSRRYLIFSSAFRLSNKSSRCFGLFGMCVCQITIGKIFIWKGKNNYAHYEIWQHRVALQTHMQKSKTDCQQIQKSNTLFYRFRLI